MHESVLTHREFSGCESKGKAELCCWRSKRSPGRCANGVRFELIHLQFKYPGWGDTTMTGQKEGAQVRVSWVSRLSFGEKEPQQQPTRHPGPTWTSWVWSQDVSSSLQTSSPSPASPTRTGSAPETLLVGFVLTLGCSVGDLSKFHACFVSGSCHLVLKRFTKRKQTWQVDTYSIYGALFVTITTLHINAVQSVVCSGIDKSNLGVNKKATLDLSPS